MRRAIAYGTAVLALTAAPLMAQQPAGVPSQPSSIAPGQAGSSGGSDPRDRSPQGGGVPQGAQGRQTSASGQSSSLAAADRTFIQEAAHGGLAEVELGKLAGEKASSADVKQFAQRIVQDHGRANDELKTLAQNKDITLPNDLDATHKATKDRLEKLSGAAFDRAYMQEMVQDHEKDVREFRKQAQSAQDADLKAWAAKTLPTLEQHFKMAQEASRAAVGTSGSQSPAPTDRDASDSPRGTSGSAPAPAGGQTDRPADGSTPGPHSGTGGPGHDPSPR